jgi:type II secretory pathway pseudopilin PulG
MLTFKFIFLYWFDLYFFMKKNKKGVFLSLELLVAILVIISLLVIAVLGIFRMRETSKITAIINEASQYLTAAENFKIEFSFWPGDLNLDILQSVNKFDNNEIITSFVTYATTTQSTLQYELGNGEISMYKYDAATGNPVSGFNEPAKNYMSFRHLAISGLISAKAVDYKTPANYLFKNTDIAGLTIGTKPGKAGIILPIASFDNKLLWWFESIAGDQYRSVFGYPKSTYASATTDPTVSGSYLGRNVARRFPVAFDTYKTYWKERYQDAPLLILFKPSDDITGTSLSQPGSSYNQSITGHGAISPQLTKRISDRMSSGRPFAVTGTGVGKLTVTRGGWLKADGCFMKADGTNFSASLTDISDFTLANMDAALYNTNDFKDPEKSCILLFKGERQG